MEFSGFLAENRAGSKSIGKGQRGIGGVAFRGG